MQRMRMGGWHLMGWMGWSVGGRLQHDTVTASSYKHRQEVELPYRLPAIKYTSLLLAAAAVFVMRTVCTSPHPNLNVISTDMTVGPCSTPGKSKPLYNQHLRPSQESFYTLCSGFIIAVYEESISYFRLSIKHIEWNQIQLVTHTLHYLEHLLRYINVSARAEGCLFSRSFIISIFHVSFPKGQGPR